MTNQRIRWITGIVIALVALYDLSHLEFTNSIKHFIPAEDEAERVDLSLKLVDSALSRRMVLSIGGGPERTEVAAALSEALRSHPEVEWIESEIGEAMLRGIYDLYFDRRVYLVSDHPSDEIPAMLGPAALDDRAKRLRRTLTQPGSFLNSRIAGDDPLGLFERVVDRIYNDQPVPSADGGSFDAASHAIILVGLRSSPFDSDSQAPLLGFLDSEFARLNDAAGGGFVLEASGVNRIAMASEQSIRRDANFISVVSVSAVCALFLVVFGSLRQLATAIITPISGFAAALAVSLAGDDPVHGITLGFGFVLMGVAIDYPVHLANHHALTTTGTSPWETAAQIRASLLLSGATTALAFTALALSEFPGLREMGVFAAIGVSVSLAITLLAIPAFMNFSGSPTGFQTTLANGLSESVAWLARHRGVAVAIFTVYGAVTLIGVPQLRWEDDPSALLVVDPDLLRESERVRRRVADFDGGRFVVAMGADAESAIALNDQVARRLKQAINAGQLGGMNSLHSFLWSQSLQRANLDVLRSVPDIGDRIDRSYSRNGFRGGSFRSFDSAIASPAAAPLRPDDLIGTPVERMLDSIVEIDGRWAVVTYLQNADPGGAIQESLAGLDGVYYIDEKAIVAEIYRGYRVSTLRMVLLGCAIVFVVLQIRYRNFRRGLFAFLLAAVSAATTVGVLGLAGIAVNVISAISLLVVLGMGVDYGVFAVYGAQNPARIGATLASIFVSCLTSVFVFGALALSEQVVLRSIGLTTAIGVLLALLLSPAVFALAQPSRS